MGTIENAEETLAYIEALKEEMGLLLHSKTRLFYSGMHITTTEYDHALTCIHEIIDDMLRMQIREARSV